MKKLMTLMLGMAIAFTTVAVTFAQDAPKKEDTKKTGKKKWQEEDRRPQEGRRPLSGFRLNLLEAA